jgi:phosphatidylserine/phosphatidylglycerophosphate/cardiolipin synthase-like enzyme
VKLQVFGHKKEEVRFITSIYRDYDVEGYYYKNPNEKSLYHIKAIIIDGLYIYIGSANLSKNALQNSAELGIFLENRKIAESISNFTQHLIESELLVVV